MPERYVQIFEKNRIYLVRFVRIEIILKSTSCSRRLSVERGVRFQTNAFLHLWILKI